MTRAGRGAATMLRKPTGAAYGHVTDPCQTAVGSALADTSGPHAEDGIAFELIDGEIERGSDPSACRCSPPTVGRSRVLPASDST